MPFAMRNPKLALWLAASVVALASFFAPAHAGVIPGTAESTVDSPRSALDSAMARLKDNPADQGLLKTALTSAIKAHDYPTAIDLANRLLKQTPNDSNVLSALPMLYLRTDDEKNFNRSRNALIDAWTHSYDPKFQQQGLFALNAELIGDFGVTYYQCFKVSGRFGIQYIAQVRRSGANYGVITLEHGYADGLIDAQMHHQKDVYPSISIDFMSRGGTRH